MTHDFKKWLKLELQPSGTELLASDPKELFAALHNLDEECLEKLNLEFERLRLFKKPLKSLLIFGINVWFLNMNAMNSSKAYKNKNDRIRKKKASRPRHLFQSSFRLLEEKWRKSCWPNLVKIKDKSPHSHEFSGYILK
ncbi:hypothetical protein Glove_40g166 [Diversispora epigaea]|uniref:Uncharacterized protein n=1 Tax=Diversispora epigaea TaxID=1348612 RepID=A0A397JPR5_9GLOM|nr:hypothetical protein Glove_40g166 [Diversispora epigaea]